MSYRLSKAVLLHKTLPLSVLWSATITLPDGSEYATGDVMLSSVPAAHADPSIINTDHHSPEAAAALAACSPEDLPGIMAAVRLDAARVETECGAAREGRVDLLAAEAKGDSE